MISRVANVELERTPGMAAVSQRQAGAGDRRGPSAPLVANRHKESAFGQQILGLKGQSPLPSPGYKEYHAKTATVEAKSSVQSHSDNRGYKCRSLVVLGECEHGEFFVAKTLYCGKEWCPECGEDWSAAHQRRFARLLPKFRQIEPENMGYFVIEWPDRYRKDKSRVYSKVGLRKSTNIIVDALAGKRKGRKGRVDGFFSRGIIRWHYFGDLKAGKYNPHANVIVESGYIPDSRLEIIKSALRESLNCPDLIVNYHYRKSIGEMIHTLKYITRATFKDQMWDENMAEEIYGFRNIRTWGTWKDEPVWGDEGDEVYGVIADLEKGKCPKCGGNIHWGKPIDAHFLDIWQQDGKVKPLGGGYFEIDAGCYQGAHVSAAKLRAVSDYEIEKARFSQDKFHRQIEMLKQMGKRRIAWIKELEKMGIDHRN